MRQMGFDAKAGAERRPAHRDREPERAIEMNLRPLAPEASDTRQPTRQAIRHLCPHLPKRFLTSTQVPGATWHLSTEMA